MKHHIFTYQNGKKELALYFLGETVGKVSHLVILSVRMQNVKILWNGIWQHLAELEMHFSLTQQSSLLEIYPEDRIAKV